MNTLEHAHIHPHVHTCSRVHTCSHMCTASHAHTPCIELWDLDHPEPGPALVPHLAPAGRLAVALLASRWQKGVSPGSVPGGWGPEAPACVCPGEFAYSFGFGLGFCGLKRHLQSGWGPALEPTADLGPRATLQPRRSSLRDQEAGVLSTGVQRARLLTLPALRPALPLLTHRGAFADEPHLVRTRLQVGLGGRVLPHPVSM